MLENKLFLFKTAKSIIKIIINVNKKCFLIMIKLTLILLLILVPKSNCKTKEEWKTRIIYQLLTDRFSRTDDRSDSCEDIRNYCGGSFRGIINHLDYI